MPYPYYAVAVGESVGIFTSSAGATASVSGVSGASMMGFKTLGSAIWWLTTTSASAAATVGLGVVGVGLIGLVAMTAEEPEPEPEPEPVKCAWWQLWCGQRR